MLTDHQILQTAYELAVEFHDVNSEIAFEKYFDEETKRFILEFADRLFKLHSSVWLGEQNDP